MVRLSEIRQLVNLAKPKAPYGARSLARCYSVDDVARIARRRLPAGALGYLEGGGESEWTLRRNREAFDEVELAPRVLNDVSGVDTATRVLGMDVPFPFMLSPVGAPRMFHHEGELAVARAARQSRVPYAVSTLSTQPLEAIAAAAAGSPLMFQLYLWGDRGAAKDVVLRARDLGYVCLLLTVDSTVRSKRERELRRGVILPTPTLSLGTVLEGSLHPRWVWHFLTKPALDFPNLNRSGPTSRERIAEMFDGSVRWDDLDWIRQTWDGPVVIKGVLRPDEAARAAELGVDGIVVSNHGGRQLDHVPAALEVLPEIVATAGDRIEVLFDSGIRRGSDIAVALALGAKAVLVGRSYLYGLAAAGEAGVRHCVDLLSEELRMAMALCGARRVEELGPDLVRFRGPRPSS